MAVPKQTTRKPASRPWKPARSVLAIVGVGGLALVAFLGIRLASGGEVTQPNTLAASVGRPAPDFKAQLIEGGTFTLSEQRGKPVLVIFTASWCTSCIPEVNKMAQLQDEFGGRGLKELALSADPTDTPGKFAQLRQMTRGANLQWALDTGQKATLAYGVTATDTKVLISPEGRNVLETSSPMSLDAVRQQISTMLAG